VKLNTAITGVKLGALLAIIVAGLIALGTGNSPRLESSFSGASSSPSDYVSAIYGGYWAYAGWQGIPSGIEDMKNPRKTFLWSVILGLSVVTITYILVNIAFLLVLTPEEVKSSEVLVLTFASALSSLPLATPFSLLVFLSLFGSLLGNGFIGGRFAFAASREGHLPRFLSLLQMDSNTPLPAQILHGLITVLLLAITHKLGIILRLFVFVSIGFDLLVIASLFVFRFRRGSSPPASFTAPLIVPLLYAAFLIAIFLIPIAKANDPMLLLPLVFLLGVALVFFSLVRPGHLARFNFDFIGKKVSTIFLLVPDSQR